MIFENFSLGWQNRARQDLMKDEAVFRCVDLDMLELGALRCIRGPKEYSVFTSGSYSSEVYNVWQVDVEGAGVVLIYFTTNNLLYRYNSNTGVATNIASGIDESNVSYAPFKPILSTITYVYITDGTQMLMDNGANYYTWGLDAPNTALQAYALGSGGALQAGDYHWYYTFYDKRTGAESNPSPMMEAVTTVADDSADVIGILKSSNGRVTARRLYRTLVDGGSAYLVREIGDNVTTALLDVTDDDNLTTLMNTDQGVPETFGVVRNFSNRLWGCRSNTYPNRVWYSRGSRPDNWPSDYYLEVGSVDDRVLDAVEYAGTFFFLQTAGISALYGTTPDTFDWYKTRSHIGMAAKNSASVGPDGIYFLGYDGIYRFDGVKSARISEQIGRSFGKLASSFIDVVDWDAVDSVARSCFLNGVMYMLLPMEDTLDSTVNKILWYDTFQQVWGELSADVDYIYSDIGRGKLYGSMYVGGGRYSVCELLETNAGTLGRNDPSPSLVTKEVDFGRTQDGNKVKWLRRFRIDADGDWTLYFYVDGELRMTKPLTGLSVADRYKWYDLEEELKGISLYIRAAGTGTCLATTHVIRSIEVE